MAPPHVSKDPLKKTPSSGKIQIFLLVLTLRWKQDQGRDRIERKTP
jgi:hypothetical protein